MKLGLFDARELRQFHASATSAQAFLHELTGVHRQLHHSHRLHIQPTTDRPGVPLISIFRLGNRFRVATRARFPPTMGRYDFRAIRVRQTAKALYDAKRVPDLPPWYNTVGNIPPSEALARPVLRAPVVRGKARKPSRMFQPLAIHHPEDKLRSEFFGDHPWELARPRLVVEDSGNDAKVYDWSKIVQPGKQLDGER